MKNQLADYATLVFDCDGVVLDSNKVKTEAFRHAASLWGAEAADALVAHHVANGGVSRYAKFRYFLDSIAPRYANSSEITNDQSVFEELLSRFADSVRNGLMSCKIAEGLESLRAATPNARWMIVSGGDQDELRAVFSARAIAKYFDAGIFGSPDTKHVIVTREKAKGNIRERVLLLGDSRLDHEVAEAAGFDFLFVAGWTEFTGWKDYVDRKGLKTVIGLSALLEG